ncbi:SAM-dependent methyltransferase [uncultured Duncaniella sp.]|uniref:SAM-dependent methyltransferase n=1 Tax=uncultured Duncaniella sp. TaxID=2768039 RepID=UPI0026767DF0|nr:SAM-dependent methyltransferase [uncultured Duncaniella sp.]MCI9172157.1 SAM-dependent methyltransferase [Muribaculaceae bacterium]
MKSALYLIPSTMSDAPVGDVLPAGNIALCREIKHYVVENIRTARRFLKRCDRDIDIDSLTFTVLDEHTSPADVPAMLAPIEQGLPVGVISEAGCPAVADPGADLVAVAQQRGITVVPLVGPSSIIMSLMASGFNGQTFAFNGYLPYESRARSEKLREMERLIRTRQQTQIFIETPYRNNRLIAELVSSLPSGMRLCVASDITGPKQEIITLPLAKWAKRAYNYDKVPTIFLLYS